MLNTVSAPPAAPLVHLWTREEYLQMAEMGLFERQHVELIEGVVYDKSYDVPPHPHLWTCEEYYQIAEAGLFAGRHVELIEGAIFEMSLMGSAHATAVVLVEDALRLACGSAYFIRTPAPFD